MSVQQFHCAHCGLKWVGEYYSECPRCSGGEHDTDSVTIPLEKIRPLVEALEAVWSCIKYRGVVITLSPSDHAWLRDVEVGPALGLARELGLEDKR